MQKMQRSDVSEHFSVAKTAVLGLSKNNSPQIMLLMSAARATDVDFAAGNSDKLLSIFCRLR
jgi:hypothetical protein